MATPDCKDCGGTHYGSSVCPYLPEEAARLQAERGAIAVRKAVVEKTDLELVKALEAAVYLASARMRGTGVPTVEEARNALMERLGRGAEAWRRLEKQRSASRPVHSDACEWKAPCEACRAGARIAGVSVLEFREAVIADQREGKLPGPLPVDAARHPCGEVLAAIPGFPCVFTHGHGSMHRDCLGRHWGQL